MGFNVTCTCGKVHVVTAGSAGTTLACPCGASVLVPNLGQLRQQAGTRSEVSPVLIIEQMLVNGELPEEHACIACGVPTNDVAYVRADCDRALVENDEPTGWGLALLWLIFGVWGVLLRIVDSLNRPVKEYGRDVVFELPLRLCAECKQTLHEPMEVLDLLDDVPIYSKLLEKYPKTKVTLLD